MRKSQYSTAGDEKPAVRAGARLDASDVITALGVGLVSLGVGLFHPGAGAIVLGLALILVGARGEIERVRAERAGNPRGDDHERKN